MSCWFLCQNPACESVAPAKATRAGEWAVPDDWWEVWPRFPEWKAGVLVACSVPCRKAVGRLVQTAVLKARNPAPTTPEAFVKAVIAWPYELSPPPWLAVWRIHSAATEDMKDLERCVEPLESPEVAAAPEDDTDASDLAIELSVLSEEDSTNSQPQAQNGQNASSGSPPSAASSAEGENATPQPGQRQGENSSDVT